MRPPVRWLSCGMLALTTWWWLGAPAANSTHEQHRGAWHQARPDPAFDAASSQPKQHSLGKQRGSNRPGAKTDLERETGLSVSIDDIEPVVLTAGEPLTLSGTVSNAGQTNWRDAQVYVDISIDPATTRTVLAGFVESDQVIGTRIVRIGLFDEIGSVRPGDSTTYTLPVPFGRLPISGAEGVYHVGVSVLAQNEEGRDVDADARADTLIPFRPGDVTGVRPTKVVTLIPLTAPVLRVSNGNFADDSLAGALMPGGRLSNVLDFAAQAPVGTLHLVIDPALRDAVRDMAAGYLVQSAAQARAGERGQPGTGELAAADWLTQLDAVAARQRLSLMAWGSPDASGLAALHLPGVMDAAMQASANYANRNQLDEELVGWQPNGASTRRGLAVTSRSGASMQVVAEASLTRLASDDSDDAFPPALVSLRAGPSELTALVVRKDIAQQPMTSRTSALEFRQNLVAEATLRSLSDDPEARCAVIAVPFRWNPGPSAGDINLFGAYTYSAIKPRTGDLIGRNRVPTPYVGPLEVTRGGPPFPTRLVNAIARLHNKGRILTGILSDGDRATVNLNEQLGVAGSSAWRWHPRAGTATVRQQASALAEQISQVTVSGPTLVVLSSKSGPFPLTVTNGLDVPITVRLNVKPVNPALNIAPIDAVELAPGQRRDVQVSSRTSGSGVTQVRARLSTLDDHPFGSTWKFNVRATQFGLVIWIAMGAGAAVLFGAAAIRIYARIRGSRVGARSDPTRS